MERKGRVGNVKRRKQKSRAVVHACMHVRQVGDAGAGSMFRNSPPLIIRGLEKDVVKVMHYAVLGSIHRCPIVHYFVLRRMGRWARTCRRKVEAGGGGREGIGGKRWDG